MAASIDPAGRKVNLDAADGVGGRDSRRERLSSALPDSQQELRDGLSRLVRSGQTANRALQLIEVFVVVGGDQRTSRRTSSVRA